jgi:hypothetical protein
MSEFIRQVQEGRGIRAVAQLSIPTCGICFDQIANYLIETRGHSVGHDFRAYHECDHPFHDMDSGDPGVPVGQAGEWTQYGCPNPLCGKLLPGELCDPDPGNQSAGVLLFENLLLGT